jgi:CBS domain-containing protein
MPIFIAAGQLEIMASKIGDLMSRHVITLKKGAVVMDAVRLMAEHSISCIVVVDNSRRPAGIITERDMVKRVLRNALDPRTARIDDVMTSPVITMPADRKITDAINMMHKYRFRRIVVATENNRLLGVLTQSDLLSKVHKVQAELEEMNENLRNTIKSLRRYRRVTTAEARTRSLREKVRALEKALKKAQQGGRPKGRK